MIRVDITRDDFAPDDIVQLEDLAEQIRQELRDLRCPVHGEYAAVRLLGGTGDEIELRVSGCCGEFIETANARLDENPT